MQKILTVSQMQLCDKTTIDSGISSQMLMERAAHAMTQAVLDSSYSKELVLVLCGTGNNGGDGLATARFLHESSVPVLCAMVCSDGLFEPTEDTHFSVECHRQYQLALKSGVAFITSLEDCQPTLIIDSVFGIGLSRPIEKGLASLFDALNEKQIPIMAMDIPSGIHADTGKLMGTALQAQKTLAISNDKCGLHLCDGLDYCGEIIVCDIGISDDPVDPCVMQPTKAELKEMLPLRPKHSNKGTYGRVLCLCGSNGMCGAAILSAKAAYRAGCGLVEIMSHAENRVVLQKSLPEAIVTSYSSEGEIDSLIDAAISRADAVLIGCGLGTGSLSLHLVKTCLQHLQKPLPLILDADALNLVAANPELWELIPKAAILTPHPGEMARLANVPISSVIDDEIGTLKQLISVHPIVCILKDATSWIGQNGSSNVPTIMMTANGSPALAKGGSGDVLAGTIASLSSQLRKVPDPFVRSINACALGTTLHGMAGRIAASKLGERGVLAGDVADCLGLAIEELLSAD